MEQLREETLKVLGGRVVRSGPAKLDLETLYAKTKKERDGLKRRRDKLKQEIAQKKEQLMKMEDAYEDVSSKLEEKSAEIRELRVQVGGYQSGQESGTDSEVEEYMEMEQMEQKEDEDVVAGRKRVWDQREPSPGRMEGRGQSQGAQGKISRKGESLIVRAPVPPTDTQDSGSSMD
jgi:chromosome segregation ATPase